MRIKLLKSKVNPKSPLLITGSKSESNRLLLLQALYPELKIENLSNSDDTKVMANAFQRFSDTVDVHHAGTAMRFLTAFYACKKGVTVTITGSARMQERPIKVLVDALVQLGSKIKYLKKEGFPPLKITGETLLANKVHINADVSSQYISALLLIAPKLPHGLELSLKGKITSLPYINMSINLLEQLGASVNFDESVITISPLKSIESKVITVESDWSSASYYYSFVALSPIGTTIALNFYKRDSLQGDSVLSLLYKTLGVETMFNATGIELKKVADSASIFEANLNDSPDIAQTLAVTCFGLGIACKLRGLHTLKIKETDRLVALQTELQKFGGIVNITSDSLDLESKPTLMANVAIDTYNDHRMAMAFAPLALVTDFTINDAGVVSKSYPSFWEDLNRIGIIFKQID